VEKLGNAGWSLDAGKLGHGQVSLLSASRPNEEVYPIEGQVWGEGSSATVTPPRMEQQRVTFGNIEADIFLPNRERSLAHYDKLVVVEHPIGMRALAAADEQSAGDNIQSEIYEEWQVIHIAGATEVRCHGDQSTA
jgi:hypothetical protein